ncbi:three-helix bundle dimerization domain-containing protein [Streptomyces sp. NPDC101733]|uniref:three-helix bundle dimerization domain-containing protein n=1 Tax=Streptomyces sp. NPDC101733 TaxID=3366144 RepID=UPI00382309BF
MSVRNLVARLMAAYPLVDAATVETTVRTAYASFDRARVRAYIPILVERRSRQALGAAAGSVTGAGAEPAVTGGARSEAPCPSGPEKG